MRSFFHPDPSEMPPVILAEEFRMSVVSNVDPELLGGADFDPRSHVGMGVQYKVDLIDRVKHLIKDEMYDKFRK